MTKKLLLTPSELNERDNYKLLIGSIVPRPIALISTLNEQQELNIAPFSYFNIVTANPPIVSVSVQRKNGQLKDTARNLLAQKEAVVHLVGTEIVAEANQTAANLGPNESELSLTNFTTVASHTIQTPSISQANMRFETTLLDCIPIENDGIPTADLFLLKVQAYQIDERIYEEGKINLEQLSPVSRLAGDYYGQVAEVFRLKRPD
ncbi:flavin reductase family protein [Vagococcus xieshaowenii]|uniref:Flavin reductase family protein n=1 Tax=Vagococcus xieshaowenii TaxID=2562451 RepID=A0AAJ5JKV7_9ENTE|nr:flavin reductase family protein [Vagococcus xieshaowenii]QCA28672.1 flavin reductase family protein [Vagococcus xieshaowenii]TFZ40520.1 flavin reductase family protein [Vagococcus xieshaowenii]